MSARYLQVTENPVSVIEGEAAIVTPADTRLHLLNGVGTWVWQQCETPHSLEELVRAARQRYAVSEADATAHIEAFLTQAVAVGLVREVDV